MNMEWIKGTDRLPTEADVDKFGEILVYSPLNGAWALIPEDIINGGQYFTHWAKIEPPKE